MKHVALVKVGVVDDQAEIIIDCDECGRLTFEVPLQHLATVAATCAAAADAYNVATVSTVIRLPDGSDMNDGDDLARQLLSQGRVQ